MGNDKAIEYNSEVYKINKILNRMRNIGLNISKYEELLKNIEEELASSIKESKKEFFNESMSTDILNMAYFKAINKLGILYKDISKYEIYLKTASFCGVLRSFLSSDNKDIEKLAELKVKLLDLLDGIKQSETLDYEVEKPLIEDIYNLTYEFIKLELGINGTSEILDKIRLNEIDKNNIEREIINELEHLNLEDPKYQELVNKKHEIDSMGILPDYVTKDFIASLIKCTTTYEFNQQKLNEVTKKFSTYYEKATNLISRIDSEKTYLVRYQPQVKNLVRQDFMKLIKNIIMTLTSMGIIVSLGVGAYNVTKSACTVTKNKVTTTTYSTLNEPVIAEEYILASVASDKRLLYKYTPYEQESNKEKFTREVTTYDITNLEQLTFAEYLHLNLEELGITGKKETIKKEELSLNDLYKETYWVLQEIVVNEDDKITELDIKKFLPNSVPICILALLIDFFTEAFIMDKFIFKENVKYWGFIDGLKKIKYYFKQIKYNNQSLKNKQKELSDLSKKLQTFLLENKDIVNELEQFLLYASEEEKTKLTQKISRIRKITSGYSK